MLETLKMSVLEKVLNPSLAVQPPIYNTTSILNGVIAWYKQQCFKHFAQQISKEISKHPVMKPVLPTEILNSQKNQDTVFVATENKVVGFGRLVPIYLHNFNSSVNSISSIITFNNPPIKTGSQVLTQLINKNKDRFESLVMVTHAKTLQKEAIKHGLIQFPEGRISQSKNKLVLENEKSLNFKPDSLKFYLSLQNYLENAKKTAKDRLEENFLKNQSELTDFQKANQLDQGLKIVQSKQLFVSKNIYNKMFAD